MRKNVALYLYVIFTYLILLVHMSLFVLLVQVVSDPLLMEASSMLMLMLF